MSEENVEIVRRSFEQFKAGLASGNPGAPFDSYRGLLPVVAASADNPAEREQALEAAGLSE